MARARPTAPTRSPFRSRFAASASVAQRGDGTSVVVGITSYGLGLACPARGITEVYQRISANLPWQAAPGPASVANLRSPSVRGVRRAGHRLRCRPGRWRGGRHQRIVWIVHAPTYDAEIGNGPTLRVDPSDRGLLIGCRVSRVGRDGRRSEATSRLVGTRGHSWGTLLEETATSVWRGPSGRVSEPPAQRAVQNVRRRALPVTADARSP